MAAQKKAQISRIDLSDLRQRPKDVTFVDARSATSLKKNPVQVPGAIHVPVKQLEQRVKLLPRNRTLVTYCT